LNYVCIMDSVIESLRESVKALDKLPKQFKTPSTTKLRRLTSEIIEEMEKETPDVVKLEGLTQQVNELKG
jgi:hypothetical protein